jgi:hypothetical protein
MINVGPGSCNLWGRLVKAPCDPLWYCLNGPLGFDVLGRGFSGEFGVLSVKII